MEALEEENDTLTKQITDLEDKLRDSDFKYRTLKEEKLDEVYKELSEEEKDIDKYGSDQDYADIADDAVSDFTEV